VLDLLDIWERFAGSLALNAWTARSAAVHVGDRVELLHAYDPPELPGLGRFVAARA
jgi:hypothetical protein